MEPIDRTKVLLTTVRFGVFNYRAISREIVYGYFPRLQLWHPYWSSRS